MQIISPLPVPYQLDYAGLRIAATLDLPGHVSVSAFSTAPSDALKVGDCLWRLSLNISQCDRNLDQVWAMLVPLPDLLLIQACAEHSHGASLSHHGLWMLSLSGDVLWRQARICAPNFVVDGDTLWLLDLAREGLIDPAVRLPYCLRALNARTGQAALPARRLKMPLDFDQLHHWHWNSCIVKRAVTNRLHAWIYGYRDFSLQTGHPLSTPPVRRVPDDWTQFPNQQGVLPHCTFHAQNGVICARMSMIWEYNPPPGSTTLGAKRLLPADLVQW